MAVSSKLKAGRETLPHSKLSLGWSVHTLTALNTVVGRKICCSINGMCWTRKITKYLWRNWSLRHQFRLISSDCQYRWIWNTNGTENPMMEQLLQRRKWTREWTCPRLIVEGSGGSEGNSHREKATHKPRRSRGSNGFHLPSTIFSRWVNSTLQRGPLGLRKANIYPGWLRTGTQVCLTPRLCFVFLPLWRTEVLAIWGGNEQHVVRVVLGIPAGLGNCRRNIFQGFPFAEAVIL